MLVSNVTAAGEVCSCASSAHASSRATWRPTSTARG